MNDLQVEHSSHIDPDLNIEILTESVSGFFCIGCGKSISLKRSTQFWDANKKPQLPSVDLYYDCDCGATFAVRLEMQFIMATIQIEDRKIVELNTR